jgi:hypothetical protein
MIGPSFNEYVQKLWFEPHLIQSVLTFRSTGFQLFVYYTLSFDWIYKRIAESTLCPIGSFFFPDLSFAPHLNPVSRFTAHSINFPLSGSVNYSCDPVYFSFNQKAND